MKTPKVSTRTMRQLNRYLNSLDRWFLARSTGDDLEGAAVEKKTARRLLMERLAELERHEAFHLQDNLS